MNVKHLRQTGATEAPSTLEYGRIAISKSGKIFAGNEQNVPVESTKKAEDAIAATNLRVENTAYDIKMLQLQDILNTSEPAMICGFAEGFKNTTKQGAILKATLNTTAHRLQFDGTNVSYVSGGSKDASVDGAGFSSRLAAGKYKNIIQRDTGKKVTQIRVSPTGEFYGAVVDGNAIYGGASAYACTTKIADFSIYQIAGQFDTAIVAIPEGHQEYAYYAVEINAFEPYGGTPGFQDSSIATNINYYDCAWGGNVSLDYQVKNETAADGYYQTKDIAMGAQVTGGELYLHYTALPTGATLTPTVKIGASALTAPTSVYSARAVTIGGVSLLENKYRLPTLPAGTSVGVRIDGHRVNVADVLHLYDILVAAR